MKNYFEDSVPFIKPQDVRVKVDGEDLWGPHTSKLIRRQWNQVERNSPYKPGLRSGYQYENKAPILVMDDYGDLVYVTDEKGVKFPLTAPEPKVDVDWVSQSLVCKDDYGNSIYLDCEDEYGLYRIQDDYSEDAIFKGDKIHEGWLAVIPGAWEIPGLTPKNIQESGWEILHSHATLDGMLCVRWLGLYGDCPEEYKVKKWGFSGEPTNFWNGYWDVQKNGYDPNSRCTRRFARQVLQYETSMVKEVAAEVFPMEMGSLLARWKYHQAEESIVGLVIDPAITQLRRIYAQDCYSQYNESNNQLEAERQYLEYWEGWTGARAAYESLPMKKRLRKTYTEGFIQHSTPCAVVVYGEEEYLNAYQQSWVKKFRKNGFPIYWLQPATEI